MNKLQRQSGFALLMTLIVVSVVITVGISILDLSLKQLKLSTNAKESEVSFHAANAGMECARYWRREKAQEMETGQTIDPACFGENTYSYDDQQITSGVIGDGEVFQYQYDFTWGGSDLRCTQINTLVASSSALGTGVTTTNVANLVPGYPDGNDKYCEPGARCSIISVKGYNRPCDTVNGYGTVQREVLLQF